jgi:glycosyltransferase involved in cell wall biosynthesis
MPDQIFPMVSVICLSFKQENFVERCLRSVAGQTYSDFEIIFIDNNSPDNSFDKGVETLKKLGVKYYAHKTDKNYGIAGGFNYGVKNFAKGKYIATLACDDFWDMYNLEEKVSYFEKNPDYGMVYGNGYTYFDDTKEIVLYYKNPSISGWILRELLQAPAINPQGILYRHDVLKKLNYWDENAKVEDRELFYRLAREYTIGYLHIPLTFYRAHRSNISSNIAYMREGNEYFFKKYEEEFPKEIKIARMKQERFFAYVMSTSTPTFKTFFKLILNYKFNWLYTKEVIRCFILVLKAKLK